MKLEIRSSTFKVLFDNILCQFPHSWDCFYTNDKAKNPIVIFQVKKKKNCKKLLKLCKEFVNNSNDNFCLKRGAIKGFIISYNFYIK